MNARPYGWLIPASPALALSLALVLAGCAGAAANDARPTAAPTPPEVDRVLAHVRVLAGTIGIRAAGTDGERAAAKYIAGVLDAAGYTTAIEPFTFTTRFDDSRVEIAGAVIEGSLLDGSAKGGVAGLVVAAGTGKPEEIAAVDVRGRVALIRRGEIPFAAKAANARGGGAIAVVIANDRTGPFGGTLGSAAVDIPVVGVEGGAWDTLLAEAGKSVTVRAESGTRSLNSQNVVGRRGECRAYIGGHYDSVPASPGANDNASGTATMLELARARTAEGLCVIAFGAEELGLHGSQAYVEQHAMTGTKFVLNFDMTGILDRPMIAGDEALTASILKILAKRPDQRLKAGKFPPFASSDHVSFTAVGVPAVTITSGDDRSIHTPRDTAERIDRESLAFILGAGDATLEALLKTIAAPAR